MTIRRILTYQFVAIVAVILFCSSIAIYVSFSQSRKEEFYSRLEGKSKHSAQMLMEIDEIDIELLRKIEKNNPLNLFNERIIILDNQENIIFSNDSDRVVNITLAYIKQISLKKDLKVKQGHFEIFGSQYSYNNENIIVFVAAEDYFGYKKLKRLQLILFLVFIGSLIITYISGRLFAIKALAPIAEIISQVDNIGESNLNARLNEGNGKDEMAMLAKTFNSMLERLETAFNVQKDFIANASHELRTPLTVLIGQLDVILMKPRSIVEYTNTLEKLLSEIKDLNEISNRLLLLAKASSTFTSHNFIATRIDDILWQVRNELTKQNEDYIIHIDFSNNINDEKCLLINGNSLLLKTIVINLMDNGCKYSLDKTVCVLLDKNENSLSIKFIDKGIGIAKEEQKMIFLPFYRSKEVMTIKGHGIGLSLVEKIINLHNGTVEIESEPGQGTTFSVTLPISK